MTNQIIAGEAGTLTITHTEADGDFTATVMFRGAPDDVFRALTTTTGLSNWWTTATGSGLVGGELTFDFNGMKKVSRVDEATPCSKVRWTVTVCEPLADWVGTTINFELFSTSAGGTCVQFRHVGLTAQLECYESCSAGWRQFLRSLISYVDEGHGSPFDAVEQ